MSIKPNLSECTANFTTEAHYEYPKRLQHINGTLTHPSLGDLATVHGLQITRRMWFKSAGDFLEIMDEDSQELHEFSVVLFDKHSNIRPWLVDGGARSGSGCWTNELSVGDMLYIQDLQVKPEYRRSGVGSCLLQKLLDSPHMGYRGHAFCWPSPTEFRSDDKAEWRREQDAITTFYRKNGLRRIGLTQFFAYSPDPSHPSRRLNASSDPEPPSKDFDSGGDASELSTDEVKVKYPLQYAASADKTSSVAEAIRAAYQADARNVRKRDIYGFTPVYAAAASENLFALRALLELDPSGIAEDLNDRNNSDGLTPLEALQSSMRSTREFKETLLSQWDGYSDVGLTCEYLLTKAMGLPLMTNNMTVDEYIKKRKFGCTCGACTDGWLSPRMRFQLSVQAGLQKDMMAGDLYLFKSHHPLSASDLIYSALDYIPPSTRREIYKTFYIGFYTTFFAILHVLEAPPKDGIPTPQAVLAQALGLDTRAVQFYMRKGGKMEHALDATVDMAREQSSVGDGTFEETFDVSEEEGGLGYAELRRCANDLEFGVVRRKVGLAVGVEWGPYRDGDEGMEVDGDDHEDDSE